MESHDQLQRSDSSEAVKSKAKAAGRTAGKVSGTSKVGSHPDNRDFHDRRALSGDMGGSLKEGGDVGGGVGLVRRRMRVRVHFDRFAPQWDEW